MFNNKEKSIIVFFVLFLFLFPMLFSQNEEASELLENNKTGVISLMALGDNKEIISSGTGFVIEKGVLATSYFLVCQAKSVEGKDYKGKKVKVEGNLAFDKNFNIALLKIKSKSPALSLGNSDELEKGKKVFAIGSNEYDEITISEGTVKNLHSYTVSQKILEIDNDVSQNFNGAPLLDKNGQVLGMVIFLERRVKFVIPSNLLKTLEKKEVTKFKQWLPDDYLLSLEGAFFAGKISSLINETGRAQQYLEKVARLDPNNIEIHSLLASVYERQRNYNPAISSYKRVIELDSNRDDAYLGMGIVLLRMRRFREAIPPLEKAVQLNSDYKEAYYHIGNACEELREFDKAAEAYEKYLSFEPEKVWEANLRLGLCRVELGQFENAIPAFQQALKEKPQDEGTNQHLAQAFEKSGQHEKAEEVYNFLAQIAPESVARYYRAILMMYDKSGKNEKAIEYATKIVELDSSSAENLYNLGYMYMKTEKYKEAIEQFNKAVAINPANEYSHFNIGVCYSRLNNHRKSIEAFKKVVEMVPNNADGWFFIGIGYMQLKDFEAALEPLKKTVELRPDYGNALYNLGITYLNLHDNFSAREIHKKLTTINPSLAQKLKKFLR
ncbi:MAG: tetratricopeptide repeat protein [Candidatus Aminicenantaceae bacterium]